MDIFAMMPETQPFDLQGLRVVIVVGLGFPSAYLARLLGEATISNSIGHGGMRSEFVRVPLPVGGLVQNPRRASGWVLSPNTIILQHGLDVPQSMLPRVAPCAFLAFAEQSIRHLRVGIKLGQWFCLLALKTHLHAKTAPSLTRPPAWSTPEPQPTATARMPALRRSWQ